MKKRLLFISLVLALLLTALAPATALAKGWPEPPGPKPAGPTSFNGDGLIYVTYMPDPIIKGKIWRYQGEIVEGFMLQCDDWDLLAEAAFWSEHDSVVRVDESGNVKGMMTGTFKIIRADGTLVSTLEGRFNGKITGNHFFDLAVTIRDEGTWTSTKGTGEFEGVKAWGKWSADLALGVIIDPITNDPVIDPETGQPIITLVGPLTWGGQYTSKLPPKPWQPAIKPGKPIMPWKPIIKPPIKPFKPIIKPGKPIKPWK